MNEAIEAYPLCWPTARKRTDRWDREDARFDVSFARARDNIVREVALLAGKWPDPRIVISTNTAVRRDGLPLAGQRQPDDTGVAVYFIYKKRQMSFACDRWKKIEHNMQAIAKTIEALRGIARWGTGDMLEAAFTGFAALPPPAATKSWHEVLGVHPHSVYSHADIVEKYRTLRSKHHPDKGGDPAQFEAVQAAWERYLRETQQ